MKIHPSDASPSIVKWAGRVGLVVSFLIALGTLAYVIDITGVFPLRPVVRATYVVQACTIIFTLTGTVLVLNHRRRAAIPVFILAIDCFAIGLILQLSSLVYL